MNYKERLREYIENDEIYTEYKSGKCDMSDFDKFCIQHCNDIKEILEENQELKKQLKIKHDGFMASVEESCELAEENQKYKEVIDKAIEYINLIVLGETLNGEPVLFKEEAEGQYLLDVLKEVE